MTYKEIYDQHYNGIKDHIRKDGWFPDEILGEEIWVLSCCNKKMIKGKLYWKLAKQKTVKPT